MRKGDKKGQSIIEFMTMFGALLFFFVVFMGIVQQNISEQNEDKRNAILQSTANNVRSEISLASKATDGYSREFFIPENIIGISYEINITENTVVAKMQKYSAYYDVFNITGEIQKGKNIIKKENGTIYLN